MCKLSTDTSTSDERKKHVCITYITHVSQKNELSYVENVPGVSLKAGL